MANDGLCASAAVKRDVITQLFVISRLRRRVLIGSALSFLTLSACETKPARITLDMVVFSYFDRPIYDIYVDGKGGDISMGYPNTGGATMSGIEFELGPKRVTWILDGPRGTPRNGEKVTAKNLVSLTNVHPDARFLAVYIYPDETVELITSKHYPRASARAELEIEKLEKKRSKQ